MLWRQISYPLCCKFRVQASTDSSIADDDEEGESPTSFTGLQFDFLRKSKTNKHGSGARQSDY
jgi:hypothetical protein